MKFESLKGLRLHGIAKAIHRFFLIITFPLRRCFLFLGLLLVFVVIMAAIPMSQGVSYKHIVDWYLLRYDEVKMKVPAKIKTKPEAIERKLKNEIKKEQKKEKRKEFKFKETAAPDRRHVSDELKRKMGEGVVNKPLVTDENKDKNKQDNVKYKSFNLGNSPFRRSGIKKVWNRKDDRKPYFAKLADKQAKINEEKQKAVAVVEQLVSAEQVAPIEQILPVKTDPVKPVANELVAEIQAPEKNISYRKIDSLPLKYEETPQHIEGTAIIFSANDLSVGDNYVILYGIYTNEEKYNPDEAAEYLKELAEQKHIECDIVAYTYQNYATALCYIDGKSINQNLVDAGFADNIAL